MLMFIGFLILLACLIVGVRKGGIGLGVVSGIGLIIFIFIMGMKPGKQPVSVMLTIMAVVTCSGFLQTSRGLDVMLKYAEKLLRSQPKFITFLAPITTWFLTVLCGTGHVVYTMFPIIYDISIKQNIRPERPMAVASIASQMGVCASPASVAVVSAVALLAAANTPYGVVEILAVTIPASFIGVLVAGFWSLNRGKSLENDLDFQRKIADPLQKEFIYGEVEGSNIADEKLPKSAYRAAVIFLLGIGVIAFFGSFPEYLPVVQNSKGVMKSLSMTPTIQLMMLAIATVIMLTSKVNPSDVASSSVFRSGMVAIVSVYGVAWMASTYFLTYLPVMKDTVAAAFTAYPWLYAVLMVLVSKFINSQAAAVAVIIPLALSVGVDPIIIVGFMPACYGYFILPTYPSDLACVSFDRSGTTKIGKFLINHSFIIPGIIGVGTACVAGYTISHILY